MICADSDKSNARLIGIEYIISRRLFEGLPADEKKYWHSHSHEVGGALAAYDFVSAAVSACFMFVLRHCCGRLPDGPNEASLVQALIRQYLACSTCSSSINCRLDRLVIKPSPLLVGAGDVGDADRASGARGGRAAGDVDPR